MGREDVYFGYEFAIQGGALPDESIAYYVDRLRSDPDALRGSLGFYRAFDATLAQNDKRASEKLPMPVLAIGGAASYGDHVARGDGGRRRRRAGRGHRSAPATGSPSRPRTSC